MTNPVCLPLFIARKIFLFFLILCTSSFFTRTFHDFGSETPYQCTTRAVDVEVCRVPLYVHIIFYYLIPLAWNDEGYFLPIRVILATLTVVTSGRKNDKCGLIILRFFNELKAITKVGTSDSMEESRSSEVNICPATQDVIRILRNAMFHSRVRSSSPPGSISFRKSPLHHFPFHFLRYILILHALLRRRLSSLSQLPTKTLNYLVPHFASFFCPLFSLKTNGSFRPTFLKTQSVFLPSHDGQSFKPVKIMNTIIVLHQLQLFVFIQQKEGQKILN